MAKLVELASSHALEAAEGRQTPVKTWRPEYRTREPQFKMAAGASRVNGGTKLLHLRAYEAASNNNEVGGIMPDNRPRIEASDCG